MTNQTPDHSNTGRQDEGREWANIDFAYDQMITQCIDSNTVFDRLVYDRGCSETEARMIIRCTLAPYKP